MIVQRDHRVLQITKLKVATRLGLRRRVNLIGDGSVVGQTSVNQLHHRAQLYLKVMKPTVKLTLLLIVTLYLYVCALQYGKMSTDTSNASQKDTAIQIAISVALGGTAFFSFCVCQTPAMICIGD